MEKKSSKRFQFPPNGKAHSDTTSIKMIQRTNPSFNSLQTGRHIQTNHSCHNRTGANMFQFPPNGKAHSDGEAHGTPVPMSSTVSIPSKREGTFRLCVGSAIADIQLLEFRFPPNGKAHSDWKVVDEQGWGRRVSIPSKREGTFRLFF